MFSDDKIPFDFDRRVGVPFELHESPVPCSTKYKFPHKSYPQKTEDELAV